MQVKIYLSADGAETLQSVCDLWECFPEYDAGYNEARAELGRIGCYWIGGGAAPLFLLMRA